MLSVHQISHSYSIDPLLVEVTFNLNPGERLGLVGPNGCGKTTLLRILAGELRPQRGSVQFSPADLRWAYLPQGADSPLVRRWRPSSRARPAARWP